MQTDNRVLDSVARFFTNAAGAAQSFRAEVETMIKGRLEKMLSDLDLVTRDEFDAVKAMAAKARVENERLAARLAVLEGAKAPKMPASNPRPKQSKARKGKL